MKKINFILILLLLFSFSEIRSQSASSCTIHENFQNGLIGYWPFCGNANDVISQNNGTAYGATLATDRFGNTNSAYEFSSNHDRIAIPPNTDYESETVSISFWVNPHSIATCGYNTILNKGIYSNATAETYIFYLEEGSPGNNGRLEVGYKNSTCTPAQGWTHYGYYSWDIDLVDAGATWTHYMITIDSNNLQKVYQNGVFVGQDTVVDYNHCSTGSEIIIGSEWANYARTFDGLIDDVAIWNRVLSAAEVNSYYNNSSTCDESTPSNQLGCDIDGESQNDYSGYGIDMSDDGTIVAIGAVGNIGENGSWVAPGHVRVYKYDNGSWAQLGADIDGPISYDGNNSITGDFGHSVALSSDGTILAVGDRYYSPGSTVNTGLVNVYQYYFY